MKTSPHKLREIVKRNSLNGTVYQVNGNNCKDWTKGVIKAIGFKLLRALPEEDDSEEREAEFFLYSKPLRDFFLKYSKALKFHHWALVVKFEDGQVRTLEGDCFQFLFIY